MSRTTSLEAYADLVAGGVITERQALAWVTLHRDGPMTGRELDDAAGARGLWKRLSELKSLGLVEELAPRLCRVTRRAALVWRACSPVATVEPTSTAERRRTFYVTLHMGKPAHVSSTHEEARKRTRGIPLVEIVEVREVRRTTTRSA